MTDVQKLAVQEVFDCLADIEKNYNNGSRGLRNMNSELRSRWMKATGRLDRALF